MMQNLLVILDKGIVANRDLIEIAKRLIGGGALFIQLRDKVSSDRTLLKEAKELRTITREAGCAFIINDRPDIVMAVDADGVHLGQGDLPCEDTRRLIGNNKTIGISTHSIKEARSAQKSGADYIGIGPIFPTKTKPASRAIGLDIVSSACKQIKIPAFFIGGVNLTNINQIIDRGGRHIAAASAILDSNDISKTTRSFADILKEIHAGVTT